MPSAIVVIINIIGILVSLFCVNVTINLQRRHRMIRSLFFVYTAIGILVWNIGHLILIQHSLLSQ